MAPGIHPSAIVGADVRIDPSVEIGPFAVIGDRVVIGRRTRIAPFALIGAGVEIGDDCRIGAHVACRTRWLAIERMSIPAHGSARKALGSSSPRRVPFDLQLARVIVHDDVEFGANSTVDRGGLIDTVIGEGTRIDNLVQIAHGVRTAAVAKLVAQAGIAGST